MYHPFQVEDESYTSYQAERNGILSTFSRCAEVVLVYFQFSSFTSDFTIEYQLKSKTSAYCFFARILGRGVCIEPPGRSDLLQS